MDILTNHPGANIIVVKQTDNEVLLRADMRDTSEEWFYWNFAVSGANGKTVRFDFEAELVGRWGPGISRDGILWAYEPDSVSFDFTNRKYFVYRFSADEDKVFFSFALPYGYRHYELFLESVKANPNVKSQILSKTANGRDVPLLVIGQDNRLGDIVLSCRHHCCESTASYAIEGIVTYVLNHAEMFTGYRFHILPFADLDGVEAGDQGKCRIPHDHNRDYIDAPIYPEIRDWMTYVRSLNVIAGFDFHCPWKWGGENDQTYFVYQTEAIEFNNKLSDIFARVTQAGDRNQIKHGGMHNLELHQSWNRPAQTASRFYGECDAMPVFTFEIPYFGKETMYSCEKVRQLGADFAEALSVYYRLG